MAVVEMTPIFRSFDETKAREFYCDFLGFEPAFEHRFSPEAPLYMGLVFGGIELHLSEHHGDSTPGSTVRIVIDNIEEFHSQLTKKNYKFAKPGLQSQEWGFDEVSIQDPFGNKLIFCQPHQSIVEEKAKRPS